MSDHGVGKKRKAAMWLPFFFLVGENAVRDAGLWMRWLLFMRAEGADEADGIIRRGSAERPAD